MLKTQICVTRPQWVKYYGAFALSQSLDVKQVNSFQKTRTHTITVICISDKGSQSINNISYAGRFKIGISETSTLQTLDAIDHTRCSTVSSGSARTSHRIQSVSVTNINCTQRSYTQVRLHTSSYVCVCRTSTKSEMCRQILAKIPNPDTCGRTGEMSQLIFVFCI